MTRFQPRFTDGQPAPWPLGKIVCVGRNYAAHARELNNPIPEEPLLFIKPASAACDLDAPLAIPLDRGPVHYETELALLVGETIRQAPPDAIRPGMIAGYGLALDLTLRELQSRLKKDGHPWEKAKAFDGACPLSAFLPGSPLERQQPLHFTLTIDQAPRQAGDTGQMLTPLVPLIATMSQHFTLEPGDVILTGTPEGVGVLQPGQELELTLEDELRVQTRVAPA